MKRWWWFGVVLILLLLGILYVLNQNGLLLSPVYKNYNLSEEFDLSDASVAGYGVYNQDDIDSLNKLVAKSQEILNEYGENEGKLYFIFGNEEKVTLVSYDQIFSGSVGVVIGDRYSYFKIRQEDFKSKLYSPNQKIIEMEIEGFKYSFELKKNENSYFIIYKNTVKKL